MYISDPDENDNSRTLSTFFQTRDSIVPPAPQPHHRFGLLKVYMTPFLRMCMSV